MRIKTLKLALAAVAAVLMLAPYTASQAIDTEERAEIELIIREYLLSNPELLLEVQQALETKQREEAAERAALALNDNRDTIFNSPNQGVIGNNGAPITIVEFFDYNCGFCQRAMDDMNALLKVNQDLKFVMKELPILSEGSVEASRISTAVYRLYPDRYAEFHNSLLGRQGMKDGNRALEVAREMELNVDELSAEARKDDVIDAFREANSLATSLGINGTPSYVIGDEVVFGALGQEVLQGKIDNVKKCGKTVCS